MEGITAFTQNTTMAATFYRRTISRLLHDRQFPKNLYSSLQTRRTTHHLEKAITAIAERFRSTHDLAGVAEAIYGSEASRQLIWANDPLGRYTAAETVDDFIEVKRMSCYEFVHFVAFLAGEQPTRSGNDAPQLDSSAGHVCAWSKCRVYDRNAPAWPKMNRGDVVVGIVFEPKDFATVAAGLPGWIGGRYLPTLNNSAGFYHVGIALDGYHVISLSSDVNLHKDSLFNTFNKGYSTIQVGPYNWFKALHDPH
jgi:hypothetical protein